MLNEEVIHIEIERIIRAGELIERIDKADIKRIAEIIKLQPNLLPSFSIDEYVRKRFAESASLTLNSLATLKVFTSDNNISFAKNEILKPDIICINAETQQIVIFEFKRSTQTERQALTELLAYEHELKNLLPFLTNYDTTFVLVSTEWSVLLEHAATSAIMWSNKSLLCLKVDVTPGDYKFNIHTPSSWSITGTPFFPPTSISSFTLSFESPVSMSEDEISTRLYLALGFFAREAERMGLHGFAVLTKQLSGYADNAYEIIFCAASPLAFFRTMLQKGKIDIAQGHLSSKISEFINEFGTESGVSSLLDLVTKVIDPRLEYFENAELGRFTDWEVARKQLQESALPTMTEFWGLPGDYARDYISHPAVQKARSNLFSVGLSDWRDPNVGLWLIRNLFEPEFSSDGFIRPSDSFRLGLAIGRHTFLISIALNEKAELKHWDALMFWNFATLMSYMDEISILARTANGIKPPSTKFRISAQPDISSDPTDLIAWVESEILQDDPFHIQAFYLGLNLGPAIIPEDFETSDFWGAIRNKELINEFSVFLGTIVETAIIETSYSEPYKQAKLAKVASILQIDNISAMTDFGLFRNLPLTKLCELTEDVLVLADMVVPAVAHLFDPLPPTSIDWDNLKRGIDGMYREGKLYPAIYVLANGSIGTASYDENIYAKVMMKIADTDEEVYLMDASLGIEVFKIVKWADIRAGLVIKAPE